MSKSIKNESVKSKQKSKKRNAAVGATLSFALLVSPLSALASNMDATSVAQPRTLDIEVSSHWFGEEAKELDITLLGDGKPVSTATLSADGDWTHVFKDVPQVVDGKVVQYELQNENLSNYHTHVSGDARSGFDVVGLDTDTDVKTDIPVEKNWIGEVGENAEIILFIEGKEVDRVILDEDNDWEHTFGDMPIYESKDGGATQYSVQEVNVDGYDTIIRGSQTEGFAVSNIKSDNAVIEGGIVARYVDEEGREIAYRVNLSGKLGADYEVAPKEIAGFELVETHGETSGEFGLGVNEVIFQYKLVEEAEFVEGRIVTKYVDENGTEIALREHHSGEIGTDYNIPPKEINGYTLNGIVGNDSGQYTHGVNEIIYEYVENVEEEAPVIGTVVTKYVDRNGNEIAERERTSGEIGTHYDTVLKQIDGYGFVEVRGSHEGDYAKGITIVEFVYDYVEDEFNAPDEATKGNVIVRYVTEDGVQLLDSSLIKGKVGDIYEIEKQAIEGYKLVSTVGNPIGVYEDSPLIVEFVYAPVASDTPEAPNPSDKDEEDTPIDDSLEEDKDTNTGNNNSNNDNDKDEEDTPIDDSLEEDKDTNTGNNNSSNDNDKDEEDTPIDDSLEEDKGNNTGNSGTNKQDGVNEDNDNNENNDDNEGTDEDTPIDDSLENSDGDGGGNTNTPVGVTLEENGDVSDTDEDNKSEDNNTEDANGAVANTDNNGNNRNASGNNAETAEERPQDGQELPETATSTYNWLVAGVGMVVAAVAGFFGINRRKKVTDGAIEEE